MYQHTGILPNGDDSPGGVYEPYESEHLVFDLDESAAELAHAGSEPKYNAAPVGQHGRSRPLGFTVYSDPTDVDIDEFSPSVGIHLTIAPQVLFESDSDSASEDGGVEQIRGSFTHLADDFEPAPLLDALDGLMEELGPRHAMADDGFDEFPADDEFADATDVLSRGGDRTLGELSMEMTELSMDDIDIGRTRRDDSPDVFTSTSLPPSPPRYILRARKTNVNSPITPTVVGKAGKVLLLSKVPIASEPSTASITARPSRSCLAGNKTGKVSDGLYDQVLPGEIERNPR